MQAKDRQIDEKIHKIVDLMNELNTLKQERTQEVWLLKQEIQNLSKKNKDLAKTNQGSNLLTASPCCDVYDCSFLISHEHFFLLLILRTQQHHKEQKRNVDRCEKSAESSHQ
jgi:hypothetical protein